MNREDCWYKDVCTLECSDSCIRYKEMKFLMDSSGIPKNQQMPLKLTPITEEDREIFVKLNNIKLDIKNWVAEGNNLYISSESPGTSKTSWALKLILKYFDEIWSGNGFRCRGVFVHVPSFLIQLKNFDNPLSDEYKDNLLNADLVIWDDIAASKLSEFEYNNLLMFLDNRIFSKKSNIFTSNVVTKNTLEQQVGGRLASRIYGTSEILTLTANDYREVSS